MKISIFLIIASLTLLFASCQKKDYVCECQGGFSGGGIKEQITNATKGKAERICYGYNSGPNTDDGLHHCELK